MTTHDAYNLGKLGGLTLLLMGATGCLATRNYVRNEAIAPTQAQLKAEDKKLDTKTSELDQRISEVDRHAEQGYSEASGKAEAADKHAQQADQAAQGAQQTADKGVTIASKTQDEVDNIDNYQQVKTDSVLFRFNHSDLTDDEQQKLESLAQNLSSLKHYAIEVEGFTDSVGSKQYNLQLSQRRADAVVRYLTENDHVPLVKIHVIGLGEDQPVSDNHTRDGRKDNRRVEIRIMAPQLEGQQHTQLGNTQATAGAPTAQ